jgi:hypothetical protein
MEGSEIYIKMNNRLLFALFTFSLSICTFLLHTCTYPSLTTTCFTFND